MKQSKSKGFTLIELLVVIAIIGILATMVISSLGQARTRARDAAIRAAISSARADIEMHNLDASSGGYLGADVTTFNNSIVANGGNVTSPNGFIATPTTGAAYRYYSPLNSPSTGMVGFCADSTGFAGEIATAPIATQYSC